jgi:hypothetical protein
MRTTRILVALALLAAPAFAQDKVELRWKFKEGQVHTFRNTQKNITSFGGQQMEQEQGQTQQMTVKAVDAQGVADLEFKITGMSVKARGLQEMEWDSEKDKDGPGDPQSQMLSRMLGQTFLTRMSPAGKVLEVKGMDKILDAMLKDAGQEAQLAATQLKEMFSNDAQKGMMQQMAPQLPERAVGKGDTWQNDFTLKFPMMGGLKFAITSKLADLKGDEAVIEQDIKMEMKAEADPNNPLAGLMEIKSAKGTATSSFSVGRGLFLSQKTSMEMTISANGQEIPIKTQGFNRLVEK